MSTLNSYFSQFVTNITPSRSYINNQITGHSTLRKRLKEDDEFGQYHVNTFIQGSYARNTAIHPGKDVDVIVVTKLHPTTKPEDAMDLMKKFLRKYYSGSWGSQTRSFNISLSYVNLDVIMSITDYIPQTDYILLESAFSFSETVLDWKKYPLKIPDRDMMQWIVTHPKAVIEWTKNRNNDCNGMYLSLVKIFKWWRQETYSRPKRPKGYILERIVDECVDIGQTTLAGHVLALFRNIVNRYKTYASIGIKPQLLDRGIGMSDVLEKIEADHFCSLINKVEEALELIEEAYSEEDDYKSALLWKKVFGNKFPEPSDRLKGASFPDHEIKPNKPAGFA